MPIAYSAIPPERSRYMNLPIRSLTLFVFAIIFYRTDAEAQAVIGTSLGSELGGSAPKIEKSTPSAAVRWKPLSSINSALTKQGPLAQWGPIAIRPHFSYSLIYGNGLLRVPGDPENTSVHTLSPGLLMEIGQNSSFDYTISRRIYSSSRLPSSTDHNVRFDTNASYGDLKAGLSASYGVNSPTLVETGGQTNEDTFALNGNALYRLGDRSTLDLGISRSDRSATPVTRSPAWTGSDWTKWWASSWFRYTVSEKFIVSVGLGVGYDEISDNPNMSYTQPQLQVVWRPSDRFSASAEVGLERRKTEDTFGETQENGTYNTSLAYRPFQTTTLSLGANRNISTSYFADQTTQTEGWRLSAEQRVWQRFYLSASTGQGRVAYLPTTNRPFVPRDDRYDTVSFRVSTPIWARGSVALYYQRSHNTSTQTLFEFTTHLYGFEFSYRF